MLRHANRERGSVLFLFPAGFLAVLVLAAIAVDAGNAFLQQRALADAADAAANDAVTYGLDQDRLRADGTYVLDPARVATAVGRSLAGAGLGPGVTVTIDGPAVNADGDVVVTVHLSRRVDHIFGGAVGGSGGTTVRATGSATAVTRP